jgi:putative flippase GtrA
MKEFFSLLFGFQIKALFVSPTENSFVQFFRFLFVGGIATVVDVAVVTLSYETCGLGVADLSLFGFDLGALLASALGFVVGLAVNYLLSIVWIFRNQNIDRIKEFLSFALIGMIGLVVKLLTVALLERYVLDLSKTLLGLIPMVTVVSCIATLVAFVWNFVARKFILYSGKNMERLQK